MPRSTTTTQTKTQTAIETATPHAARPTISLSRYDNEPDTRTALTTPFPLAFGEEFDEPQTPAQPQAQTPEPKPEKPH